MPTWALLWRDSSPACGSKSSEVAQAGMSVVERLQSNWSEELPHGVMEWEGNVNEVAGLETLPNRSGDVDGMQLGVPSTGNLGLVLSSPGQVDEYVETHADGNIDVPQYYSGFPERDELVVERGGDGLRSDVVEAGIRVLNGGGRYDESEFTLYDCLQGDEVMPCPLVREGHGCVLLTPALKPE